jgi:hypothetical protein
VIPLPKIHQDAINRVHTKIQQVSPAIIVYQSFQRTLYGLCRRIRLSTLNPYPEQIKMSIERVPLLISQSFKGLQNYTKFSVPPKEFRFHDTFFWQSPAV